MSISNFSNYIVISGKGIAICKAILVPPSTSHLYKSRLFQTLHVCLYASLLCQWYTYSTSSSASVAKRDTFPHRRGGKLPKGEKFYGTCITGNKVCGQPPCAHRCSAQVVLSIGTPLTNQESHTAHTPYTVALLPQLLTCCLLEEV